MVSPHLFRKARGLLGLCLFIHSSSIVVLTGTVSASNIGHRNGGRTGRARKSKVNRGFMSCVNTRTGKDRRIWTAPVLQQRKHDNARGARVKVGNPCFCRRVREGLAADRIVRQRKAAPSMITPSLSRSSHACHTYFHVAKFRLCPRPKTHKK